MIAAFARTFTKDELAQVLGVREALVRQWTRDGTIPAHFFIRDGDRTYKYAPLALAVGELMKELGQIFGENSKLPKAITRQIIPQIERAWHEPELPVRLTVLVRDDFELRMPLTFMARAKELVAHAA